MRKNFLMLPFLGISIFLYLFISTILANNNTPLDVVQRAYDLGKKRDYRAIYRLLSSEIRRICSEEEFEEFYRLKNKYTTKSPYTVELKILKMDKDEAEVEATIKLKRKDRKTYTKIHILKKENGQWKITNFFPPNMTREKFLMLLENTKRRIKKFEQFKGYNPQFSKDSSLSSQKLKCETSGWE